MTRPRSIADVVRGWSAEQLVRLLRLRPDLALPRPLDLAELIERASSGASTQLAIEALDAWQLRVCHGLAACDDSVTTRRLAALLQADRADVQHAAEQLAERALAWGGERGWHLTRSARTSFGAHPAGLAPSSTMPLADGDIDDLVAEAGPAAREVLERLLWTNPTGRVAQADRRGHSDSDRPVDRLLFRRLVRPLDAETIVLPREVALRLRGGRLFADPVPSTVPGWPAPEDTTASNRAALGSAFELVRHVETLLEALDRLQPRPLATGAISRRDFTTLAAEVGDPGRSLVLLACAQQAGLLASTGSAWLPSVGYDRWLQLDDWHRWQLLRDAWLAMPTWPNTEGPILAPTSPHAWAVAVRELAHRQLLAAPPGTPIDAGRLAERLAWLRPGWERMDMAALCDELVSEFSLFGLVALGRRSELADTTEDPGFPEPVAEFMVQSDLTAVAPAPLQHEVAHTMRLLADVESTGGAGVHRFTADSLRRGLDAGWTADEVRAWLREHSSTPIPQGLDYLLDDVARRHGQVQVAAAASVVTVDDPAVAQAVVQRPDASALGLRLLAPTVLAASAEPAELVDFLRSMGLAPIATDEFGRRRTAPGNRRSRAQLVTQRSAPVEQDATALVRELLARDDDRRHVKAQADIMHTLQAHVGEPGWLAIDYVANDGTPRSTTARVMVVSGGTARLMEKAVGPMTLPVARMIGVRPLA